MYGGANDSSFFGLPTGLLFDCSVIDTATDTSLDSGQLLLDDSVIDIATDPSLDSGQFFSQGPSLGGEGWNINHWLMDIPLNTCNSQVDEEVGLINLRDSFPVRFD